MFSSSTPPHAHLKAEDSLLTGRRYWKHFFKKRSRVVHWKECRHGQCSLCHKELNGLGHGTKLIFSSTKWEVGYRIFQGLLLQLLINKLYFSNKL